MLVSVEGGKYHRLAGPVTRDQAWKPSLTVCGRTVNPLNYFETEADADRYTGGRLAQYACSQCRKEA